MRAFLDLDEQEERVLATETETGCPGTVSSSGISLMCKQRCWPIHSAILFNQHLMRCQVLCLADTNVSKTVLVPDFPKLKVCHGKQTGDYRVLQTNRGVKQ